MQSFLDYDYSKTIEDNLELAIKSRPEVIYKRMIYNFTFQASPSESEWMVNRNRKWFSPFKKAPQGTPYVLVIYIGEGVIVHDKNRLVIFMMFTKDKISLNGKLLTIGKLEYHLDNIFLNC